MLRAAAVVAIAAADLVDDEHWPVFQQFIEDFGRTYQSESEVLGRFSIFKDNLKRIEARNSKGTSKHGINKFADLSPDEFSSKYLGRIPTSANLTKKEFPRTKSAATSVNWCDQGHCTPVKDQGHCGSCWAFGGTEMLESDFSIRFGKLYTLSTQQVTSCDTNDGGCNGGNAVNAWGYANATGGLEPASDYPYTSGTTQQTGSCIASKVIPSDFKVSACQSQWISLSAADEGNMIIDIPLTPLSVAVAADYWQTYVSGVVSASDGCGTALDHNVQVTGFNAEGNYYIVRNSWGTGWGVAGTSAGEKGFIYVEAGSNVCGIALECAAVVTCPAQTSVSV